VIRKKYYELETELAAYLKRYGVSFLRYSMAMIYFWYGTVKVFSVSPVEELVRHATHWIGVHNFVIFLGVWEMAIGLGLFIKKFNRLGLLLLFLHFPGTFLPLFLNPEDCFIIFPYALTLEGQYIFKNLISIGAGLILISSLDRPNTIFGNSAAFERQSPKRNNGERKN
jgi:hypothetical protein